MKTVNDSIYEVDGEWWFLQKCGTRQRAKIRTCKTCGIEFASFPSSENLFCSMECYRKECKTCGGLFNPKTVRQVYCSKECKQKKAICHNCGGEFIVGKGSIGKFCSKTCGYDYLCPAGTVGDFGGGYKIVKVSKDTIGTRVSGKCRTNWMLQHRYVMQQKLGRVLDKSEHVHHINGKRDDNRPENLELWKRSHPYGVRSADYHCAGCRCFDCKDE